jgi:hypothetical protein
MSGQTSVQPWRPAPVPSAGDMVNQLTGIRDYQAKQATSDAYQQSIDPNTGAFDQGKFNALISSTPQGAWNAGPAMQQSGQAQQATGQGQTAQIQAKQAQLNGIGQYMTPLMQKVQQGQPVSGADVLSATQNAVDAGFVTPEMAANIKNQVASLGPNGDASNLVRGAYFGTQAGLEQLKTLAPPVQAVSLGGSVQPFQPSPLAAGGAGFTGRGVGAATSMTPYQAVTPLDIRMTDGSIQQVLPGNVPAFIQQNPGASVVGPSAGGPVRVGGTSGGAGTVPGLGSGTYQKPAGGAPAASGQPLTVGPPPQPTAGRSAPLGAAEAASVGVAGQGALGASAGSSPQRQAILSDMSSALQGPNPINSGPYSDWAGTWSALVNRLPDGLASLIPGMTKEQVAGQEGFVKMAEQLRQLQGQQIAGALTNDKFASALASSPHLALSTLGNLGMIHILQGNEDAITAKNNAWQQSVSDGWQPQNFRTWEGQYNQTPAADPRIYWLQHMTPSERIKFVDGITSTAEKASLRRNYNLAFPAPSASQ